MGEGERRSFPAFGQLLVGNDWWMFAEILNLNHPFFSFPLPLANVPVPCVLLSKSDSVVHTAAFLLSPAISPRRSLLSALCPSQNITLAPQGSTLGYDADILQLPKTSCTSVRLLLLTGSTTISRDKNLVCYVQNEHRSHKCRGSGRK